MSSTAKNTIIIVAMVIVIIVIFFVFRNKTDQPSTVNGNATSTVNANDGGSRGASTPNSPATIATINNDATLNALLNSTVIRVPNTGVDVALTKGTASYTYSNTKGTITRGAVLGKIPTNDGYDVFTTLTIQMQNSSTSLQYVALFKVLNSTVTYTSAVLVGDRVTIQGIEAKTDPSAPLKTPQQYFDSKDNYNLTITYLDRKNGEALTAVPSVSRTLSARVKNHLVTK